MPLPVSHLTDLVADASQPSSSAVSHDRCESAPSRRRSGVAMSIHYALSGTAATVTPSYSSTTTSWWSRRWPRSPSWTSTGRSCAWKPPIRVVGRRTRTETWTTTRGEKTSIRHKCTLIYQRLHLVSGSGFSAINNLWCMTGDGWVITMRASAWYRCLLDPPPSL